MNSEEPIDKPSSKASNCEIQNENVQILKRNSGDVGWDYGILVNPNNLDKVKCLKCGKEFSGGVSRLKKHIANIRGNIVTCKNVTPEDIKRCRDYIEANKRKKVEKKEGIESVREEVEIDDVDIDENHEKGGGLSQSVGVAKTNKPPRTLGAMDRFVSKIQPSENYLWEAKKTRQQNIHDALFKERTHQVHEYVARWMYENAIPFNSVDNDSFLRVVEAIGQYGPGYLPSSQYHLTEPLLKGEVDRTKKTLQVQEDEWAKNGCSIMTDAWSDRNRRSIMNLCVNSRLGTCFLGSKEASLDAHTGEYIFTYVDECIEQVGEENVVQVVTDNASNNMSAANMLLAKRPRIFWTSCATHTINLMLEAIGKLPLFKGPIMKAKSFTVFIYSHHKTLTLMRKRTRRNIIRPGVTRFATAFLTLQSLLEKRDELRQMVSSAEWEKTKWSKSTKGKAAFHTILSTPFWNGVQLCLKVCTPLVKVLRLVDGDVKPAMGFVYGEMRNAREEIKTALKQKESLYKPILDIVDAKGKGRIDTPLHLTAFLLNPYYYYNTSLSDKEEEVVMNGVFECMERLYPDIDIQDEVINVELLKYKNREGAFGRTTALKVCSTNDDRYDPVGWWSNYGINVPNLRNVAKRILSLTTSSSDCERNWNVFEMVHTKKRNRLDTATLNKLVYVQFNARLMNKKKKNQKEKVDALLSNEYASAQSWMVNGVDDDDDEVELDSTRIGADEELQPRRSRRLEELREPEEDDFVSDGTEPEMDEDQDDEFDLESDKELDGEDLGNEDIEV